MLSLLNIYAIIAYVIKREKVINFVEKYRKSAGMTQEELANKVGVTRQTIISIEKGNYVPSVLLALKISREFKVSLEKVFDYES
jgi:putative transcriptional regulator